MRAPEVLNPKVKVEDEASQFISLRQKRFSDAGEEHADSKGRH
jgi:hypothetical protein